MVFFLAATMFTLLKLSGDVGALGWWDLFINFGIAECFAFLVCTKLSNPTIQREAIFHSGSGVPSSISPLISMSSVLPDAANSSSSTNDEDDGSDGMCGRQETGGHLLKIPVLVSQVLLCMRLESVRNSPKKSIRKPHFLAMDLEGSVANTPAPTPRVHETDKAQDIGKLAGDIVEQLSIEHKNPNEGETDPQLKKNPTLQYESSDSKARLLDKGKQKAGDYMDPYEEAHKRMAFGALVGRSRFNSGGRIERRAASGPNWVLLNRDDPICDYSSDEED
ncbi:hypothetical protein R1sor_026721 [Riccia sorocarpa]|uniref:Uncharacterized protein n=1 Tax=Riccia sorocarpa TaxID=122646 RepID=A0ABD3GC79_9MARC